MSAHRLVGVAVLALAAFFAAGAFWIENQSGYSGISTRTLPFIVAAGLALCGGLLFSRPTSLLLPGQSADGGAVDDAVYDALQSKPARPDLTRFGWLTGGFVATFMLIGTIGFPLAGVLLMVCVARAYGSTRPLRDALTALVLTLVLWVLFTQFLAINLPLAPALGI